MGESSSSVSLNVLKVEESFEANVASRHIIKDCIKTENLVGDQDMPYDCQSSTPIPLVSDTSGHENANNDDSSINTYLLHKLKWENETRSHKPGNPVVKFENVMDTSDDDTCMHETIYENGILCDVTKEHSVVSETLLSSLNIPFNNVAHVHDSYIRTENSTSCDDAVKSEKSIGNAIHEDIQTCTSMIEDDVKIEYSLASEHGKLTGSHPYGAHQGTEVQLGGTISFDGTESQDKADSGEWERANRILSESKSDIFSCATCCLTFSTDASLSHHMCQFHLDELDESREKIMETKRMHRACIMDEEGQQPFVSSNICLVKSAFVDKSTNTNPTTRLTTFRKKEVQKVRIVRIDNGEKANRCSICDKSFVRNADLKTHMMRIHSGEKPYTCTVCGKSFSRKYFLKTHMMTKHNGEKMYKCNTCDNVFVQIIDLEHHMMRMHNGEKPYACTECDKSYSRNVDLKLHMRTHTGGKPYKCSSCDRAFARNGELKQHMKTHIEEKPYTCTTCDKSFSWKHVLKTHIMRIHNGEKPYKCTACDKAFALAFDLKLHTMRMHNDEKSYLCTSCGKTFGSSVDLKQHIRVHSEEKLYKCTLCLKVFNWSNALKLHMRVHSGEKPYTCTVCFKAFRTSSHIQRHMRTHGGEKPYKCTACNKAFVANSELKQHTMRAHDGEK